MDAPGGSVKYAPYVYMQKITGVAEKNSNKSHISRICAYNCWDVRAAYVCAMYVPPTFAHIFNTILMFR